jgi:hypothetical protein
MNVIFYTNTESLSANRLTRVLEIHVSRKDLETCRTLKSFAERLRKPLPEPVVFVMQVSSHEELAGILLLRDLLLDRRLVLVLPDSEPDMVSQAHSLRPRFITYGDSDYLDISAVLSKWTMDTTNGRAGKLAPDKAYN